MAKNFRELSQREMSELSREEVESYTGYELMALGVPKAMRPVLEAIKVVTVPGYTMYSIEFLDGESSWSCRSLDVLFKSERTAIVAAKAVAEGGVLGDSEYIGGTSYKHTKPGISYRIVSVEVHSIDDINVTKASLIDNAEKTTRNADAKKAYDDADKAEREATSPMWEDYEKAVAEKTRMDKMRATFNDYVELAGDVKTAEKFFENAYGKEAVLDFVEWEDIGLKEESNDDS